MLPPTPFLVRALRWFKAPGITVERVMTDNGSPDISPDISTATTPPDRKMLSHDSRQPTGSAS
ncbi:hypothetical protein [Maricaulis sp. W15]|uniref:hypothetical protein n=1 Tax=Maricaulis sp. W15 TaxID=1772333 RepID=UPI001180DEB7|nr:hypothetical protein [Maricaulis sp. W15]